jgi:hypothetical protein
MFKILFDMFWCARAREESLMCFVKNSVAFLTFCRNKPASATTYLKNIVNLKLTAHFSRAVIVPDYVKPGRCRLSGAHN